MSNGFLLDKSALARWGHPQVATVLNPALDAGRLWTCPSIELEVLYSCRSPTEYDQLRRSRNLIYHNAPLDADLGRLALSLQSDLAAAGQLRAVGPMDLIIAATAITHDLTVLHYDHDYEILAQTTPDLAQQWVAPRGSLP